MDQRTWDSFSVVKGLFWYTDGSRTRGEGGGGVTRAGVYGQSLGRRLNMSLGTYATAFQAVIYMLSWPVLVKFKRLQG